MRTLANETSSKYPQGFPVRAFSSVLESMEFWISLVLGILSLAFLILTRSRSEQRLVEHYVDDRSGRYVQIFELSLRFVGNPLFRRIKLFEYSGKTSYEITGFEFGSYDTILPKGSYEDKQDNDRREVSIKEKSLLKDRQISILRVNIETEASDYQGHIKVETSSERIEITNDNDRTIRNYAIHVQTLNDVGKLRKDPKVYDAYQEGSYWVIRIKEIPARRLEQSGKEIIWL